MARKCQITGKKPQRGYSYAKRGIAKKKKGIGLNITGKTKRRFYPNLIKKRVWSPEESRFITMKICTSTLRTIYKNGLAKTLAESKK
ncbi:MAG: 50S ribosomal protein L28 [Chlamydiales bacterium]